MEYINTEMRGFTATQKRDFALNWEIGHKGAPESSAAKSIRRESIERQLKLPLRAEKRTALERELANIG